MDSNSLAYSTVAHMISKYKYIVPTIMHISASCFLKESTHDKANGTTKAVVGQGVV
jgi:hypothetical protein